ncbi:LAQU0S26e00584g1_1 [Lachancea quebecensis]|uniref:LAQU0S26e00584g1_1 n=1 Tax=Lachancea quebecensis TaxID=1654605 RepID=A0A0P1KXV7_9SACH|nr:LAQU0S26e00584g1_1 [Lachancea quebecensis]
MASDSIEDLFAELKKLESVDAALGASGRENNTPADGEDFDQDKLEFEDDSKIAQQQKTFREIEQRIRKLPRMETGFDNLTLPAGGSAEGIKVVTKVEDPVSILHSRKKDATTKKPSTTEQWFTLPKPELTKELKRDLLVLKHRAALDPKRHYKKEKWVTPERFSVGTIVEDKTEFYSSRLNNKQRKSTMVASLMDSDDTTKYFKRKYTEVQAKKTSGAKGHYRKVREKRNKM